jgi:ATP-dependent RNA helicase DeaD
MENKFEKLLGKDSPLFKTILDRGFEEPSEIQEKSIPAIMDGKDVIAGAATGSGKTLAFAAGLVKNVEKDKGIQGLVLTPTRELAEQITRELIDFAKYKNLNVISVYGGVSIYNQVKMLPNAEIVVATPGRILDHIEKRSIDLTKVNTFVLDEADRMFEMGFVEDVERIIREIPIKRQTLLYSATISQDVIRLSKKYLKEPVEINAVVHVDPKKLTQIYYDVEDQLKFSLLKHLLENEKSGLVMIFCNTRKNVDFVSKNLGFMGLEVVPIHGGFTQDKRNRFLEMFNSEKNKVKILVATDVAARGLDIKGVTHIYNYDIPLSESEYTHRIGRTARAGKDGKVINILTSRHYENFQPIIESKAYNIKQEEPPYVERVRIRWMPERRDDRNSRRGSMRHERGSSSYGRDSGRASDGGRRDAGRGRSFGNRDSGRSGGSSYGNRSNDRGSGSSNYGNRSESRDSRGGSDRRSSYGSRGGDSRGRDSGRSSYGNKDNRGRDDRRSGSSYGNRDRREGGSGGRESSGREDRRSSGSDERRSGGDRRTSSRGRDDRRTNKSGDRNRRR